MKKIANKQEIVGQYFFRQQQSPTKIELDSYDSIFQTDKGREDSLKEKVTEVPLSEIHSFASHPFKVIDDEAMLDMAESVSKNGVLVPGLVRPRTDGCYELIAGHRRKRACELAQKETMPVIIRELTDDEAVLVMVDSNLQRESLLFSEKAFAYKMKVDAIKRQSGRPSKENGPQLGVNSSGKKSYEIIGEQSGESKNQIYRYIRLTELVTELLDMVDVKKIGFNPAVELSYLKPDEQSMLLDAMEKEEATPSLSQAQRLKKFSQSGKLTAEVVDAVMSEQKKEVTKVTLTGERLRKYFPGFITPLEMEKTIIRLLETWYESEQNKKQFHLN